MKEHQNTQRQKQANTIKGSGNPNWKGGRITKNCIRCGSPFLVYPSKANRSYCSLTCANRDTAEKQIGVVNSKKIHYGEGNGAWNGGKQTYLCQQCGSEFQSYPWKINKFCSRRCSGLYHSLETGGPNWKGGINSVYDKIIRSEQYINWRDAVYKRDNYACQRCGSKEGKLNAHHIKDFCLHPDLRFSIDNGITLCTGCHRKMHS